jgi:hypothetical protein
VRTARGTDRRSKPDGRGGTAGECDRMGRRSSTLVWGCTEGGGVERGASPRSSPMGVGSKDRSRAARALGGHARWVSRSAASVWSVARRSSGVRRSGDAWATDEKAGENSGAPRGGQPSRSGWRTREGHVGHPYRAVERRLPSDRALGIERSRSHGLARTTAVARTSDADQRANSAMASWMSAQHSRFFEGVRRR